MDSLFILPLTTYSASIWLGDYECVRICDIVLVYELLMKETVDRVMSRERAS